MPYVNWKTFSETYNQYKLHMRIIKGISDEQRKCRQTKTTSVHQ